MTVIIPAVTVTCVFFVSNASMLAPANMVLVFFFLTHLVVVDVAATTCRLITMGNVVAYRVLPDFFLSLVFDMFHVLL
ncbi:hypothetical protein POTOM_060906 [Populus tomentosa]|uniref:Uncharacterized protein n=1 Tax=Populus tomentosa TaxID=118781 RepID=A0A8X7XMW2_POPTO|nr:hypothetical protein POTOM_060906 [Populus tomentosa]